MASGGRAGRSCSRKLDSNFKRHSRTEHVVFAADASTMSSITSALNPKTVLGYDTRSLRSALVMGAVDLVNPFKRPRQFKWMGPCVVSSIAGLGDLFIHLPLIA